MSGWAIWLVAAILLALIEIMSSTFVFLCFSFAAFCAAIVAALSMSLNIQIAVFVSFALVFFVTARPFFLKHMLGKNGRVITNSQGLIGKEGRVIEDIDTTANTGWVKIYGEEWRAVSSSGSMISKDTTVKVVGISGNRVIVE